MAKFYGNIGFVDTVETSPGIYKEVSTERPYSGDLIRGNFNRQTSDSINDDINISNQISIISDPFAEKNLYTIRYVIFEGVKWKIKSAEVLYPRLLLTIGGVYNG